MRFPLVAATLALVGAAPALRAQPVDATIDRAVQAWAKIKTVRGTFEQTVTNQLTSSTATARGEYAQERPNLLSIRFTQPASDAIEIVRLFWRRHPHSDEKGWLTCAFLQPPRGDAAQIWRLAE